MAVEIDTETLREWLDEKRPVTVLDVRTDEARAQWSIPGSVHIDAYDVLRTGQPGPSAQLFLPRDRPVVTVCNAGRTSQIAADVLSGLGFDARSLAGGMKAWSLAWNTAEIPLSRTAAQIVQVRRTGKGCLSYLVGSENDAIVIDPSLSSDIYVDLARQRGWRIRYVLETHVHADHLSRARQLAERTGATIVIPAQRRVHFPFVAIQDGKRITFGQATLAALRTPGHTEESTSYILNDEAIFTGDTLFTEGVGRPDLHADAEAARLRARALFKSLTVLRGLSPELLVLPAHANGPIAFDGQPVATRIGDVAAWLSDWLSSEESFVDRVLSRIPDTPPNFARIIELNESGEVQPEDPTELEAGANRCAVA